MSVHSVLSRIGEEGNVSRCAAAEELYARLHPMQVTEEHRLDVYRRVAAMVVGSDA